MTQETIYVILVQLGTTLPYVHEAWRDRSVAHRRRDELSIQNPYHTFTVHKTKLED